MDTSRTVAIACFPESLGLYPAEYAVVAVDVIRATTTAVTAASQGRRCFPVPSIEAAVPLAAGLPNPLLVGELGGNMPYGFHVNNSPADLELRSDTYRPMILLSTSGTRLICGARNGQAMYVACLRNQRAQVEHLVRHHGRVVVIGAGSRGEFREEDQMCCAWVARGLMEAGYEPEGAGTEGMVKRWTEAPVEAIRSARSAQYLIDTGQERDLDFVLAHVDDLSEVYLYDGREIVPAANYAEMRSGAPRHESVPVFLAG